jgi:hypothetical protein
MKSSRRVLCTLVVLGSLLALTNAWGPFQSSGPKHQMLENDEEVGLSMVRPCLNAWGPCRYPSPFVLL